MKSNLSFPKSKMKVLLLEGVHPDAKQLFIDDGFEVEYLKTALTESELKEKIKDVYVLGIRSKTQLTADVLQHASKLLCVGTFCIGTNQVDIACCEAKGIAVFNAPYSNTRSVVELAVGEMIMLIRKIIPKSNNLHQGIWDKTANNCYEVRGKTLGLIGYGNIGKQFSILAEALGMNVCFYDVADCLPLGNAKKMNTLESVLKIADVVSLHVDGRKENTVMIGKQEFNMMKDGAILLNLSRGHVVDVNALSAAIQSKKISGVGVDVFPNEPNNNEAFESELRGLNNVILTPHIGGSTEEAQLAIGNFVPQKLIEYINNGSTQGSVNVPELTLPKMKDSHRFLHIHKNVAGVLAKITNTLAQHQVNINGQYLKTNENIGYVITDVSSNYTDECVKQLKAIEETIKFRMLY
jgi:D-3-phosphoglycerate dehydrogenase